MIMMYSLASLPFIYVFAFAPKSELIGFITFFVINVIACFFDMILSFISVFSQVQSTSGSGQTKLSSVMSIISWILVVLFPSVNFKRALFNIRLKSSPDCISALNALLYTDYSSTEGWMTFRIPGLGASFIIFCAQMIFWWIILAVIENKRTINLCCQKCCKCNKDLMEIDDHKPEPSLKSDWDDGGKESVVSSSWNDAVC